VLVTVCHAELQLYVYVVDTVAKIRDELELVARLAEHGCIDLIGHGRHQDVGGFHRFSKLTLRHWRVIRVEAGVKKFPHSQLDGSGSLRVTMTSGFLLFGICSTAAIGGDTAVKAPI
jgi:hypothetical protein